MRLDLRRAGRRLLNFDPATSAAQSAQ